MKFDEVCPPREDELVVVVGPTASGKTELAIRLAEKWGGEIVSADSVQIYRHFDIGSGKATKVERARVPHHIIDVRDPLDPLDASQFVDLADAAIQDIRARARTPIVCGGTYLWVKALVTGLAEGAPKDEAIRASHREAAEREGRASLHARLAEVDAASAARLHPNDLIRVSRALEVWELTGRTLSSIQDEHRFETTRHHARMLGVLRSPEELDLRIEKRVAGFLQDGFMDEVRDLVARGYRDARAMGSVGYREILAHLDGEIPEPELHSTIVRATRVFVRRQRTWLRDVNVSWISME
jgi:tRNA dimethylallyltransferase